MTHLVPTGWSSLSIMWTFTQVKVNLWPSCQADFIFSITVFYHCGQPYEINDEKGTLSQIMLRSGASPSRLYPATMTLRSFLISLRAIQSFQQILYCAPNFIRASDVHFRIGLIKKNNEDYETATKVRCVVVVVVSGLLTSSNPVNYFILSLELCQVPQPSVCKLPIVSQNFSVKSLSQCSRRVIRCES